MPSSHDDLLKRIAERRLPSPKERRRIRRDAGLTLKDVGEVLGVNEMTVSRWERGKAKPRGAVATTYRQLLDQLEEVAQ